MSLQEAELGIDLQEMEAWRRRLTVTVPAGTVNGERSQALRQLSGRMKLPGFRKGKIPKGVLEKRFGPAVEREVLDRVIRAAYKEALAREELQPISEGEIDNFEHEPGEDLSFSITFDVQPVVELERLSGFVVEKPSAEVSDKEFEAVIARLRQQQGVWAPAEGRPENDDLVHVTVTNLGDEKPEERPYEFVLGAGDAIPEVEDSIRTLDPGEEAEFAIKLPTPEGEEEGSAGEEKLRIRLDSRKVLELPELDDEFAKSLGDFEDLASFQARVREDLEKEASQRAENQLRGLLLNQVVEANSFEVPASMVERYLDSTLGAPEGADPERLAEVKASLRGEATLSVKRILALEKIAEDRGLAATEEEIDEKIETIAETSGTSPAEVYGKLQKAGRIEALEREITEEKVFEFLKGQSEIVDPAE